MKTNLESAREWGKLAMKAEDAYRARCIRPGYKNLPKNLYSFAVKMEESHLRRYHNERAEAYF